MKKIAILSLILCSTCLFASNVIEKKTMRYLKSVHTPNYNNENYIINPILPKCDKKYWKIKDNKVVEMTKAEKNIKDKEIAAVGILESITIDTDTQTNVTTEAK